MNESNDNKNNNNEKDIQSLKIYKNKMGGLFPEKLYQ